MPVALYDVGTVETIYNNGDELTRTRTYLEAYRLSGGISGKQRKHYSLSYEDAQDKVNKYLSDELKYNGNSLLRVSLYLNNAMFGDLHIFVIDFDETDENSSFFKADYKLADKVTCSKSGGYHMFYGVKKEVAHFLFDSINLLASQSAAAWVSRTAAWTNDGNNKVDMFCDATRLIYEYEEWDNSKGLTDKTQALFELLSDNFTLTRPMESCTSGDVRLVEQTEEELTAQMSDAQRLIFDDLRTISSDCPQNRWYNIGVDIKHAFSNGSYEDFDGLWFDDFYALGGSIWLWWSAQGGKRFQPQSCANAWDSIINNNNTKPWNRKWNAIIEDIAVFGTPFENEEPKESVTETEEECKVNYHNLDNGEFDMSAIFPNIDTPSVLSSDAAFEWVSVPYTVKSRNDCDDVVKERQRHLLSYNSILYQSKAEFLTAMFEHYLEDAYRVEYNTDNIFWLSSNQRTRLSYHILDMKIGAKPISYEDDNILKEIARSGEHETAQRWLGRMNWTKGNAKMTTFGVGLEVKGAANGVYCYRSAYYDNKATFTAEEMTWKHWSEKMIAALNDRPYNIIDVIMMMYYQNGVYMTLPKEEQDTIKSWIYNYREGKIFPYSGVIECGKNFEIDFDRDCKIVKSKSLRHNGNMVVHNKENAAELAAARGKAKTKTSLMQIMKS